jgi:hypothetical protein
MAGEIGVGQVIARHRAVALAIGQVFKDRRHRIGLGILGQPDARGQPRAIGHGDPGVLDLSDLAGKVGSDGGIGHFVSHTVPGDREGFVVLEEELVPMPAADARGQVEGVAVAVCSAKHWIFTAQSSRVKPAVCSIVARALSGSSAWIV